MIIDAMDLLRSRRFEGFCLVSSDGDFTRLATRIREDGLTVFGFGRKDAAKAFVQACESYIFIENLINPPELARETVPKESTSPGHTASVDAVLCPDQAKRPAPVPYEERKLGSIKTAASNDIGRLKAIILGDYILDYLPTSGGMARNALNLGTEPDRGGYYAKK